MTAELLNRLANQRAACKHWSAFIAVIVLLAGALGHLNVVSLLWAAAPLLVLGLADAGYGAQEWRVSAALSASRRGSDADARKGNDPGILEPEPAGATLSRTAFAVMSLSVWPFYLALGGIVAAGSFSMGEVKPKAVSAYGSNGVRPLSPASPANFPSGGVRVNDSRPPVPVQPSPGKGTPTGPGHQLAPAGPKTLGIPAQASTAPKLKIAAPGAAPISQAGATGGAVPHSPMPAAPSSAGGSPSKPAPVAAPQQAR